LNIRRAIDKTRKRVERSEAINFQISAENAFKRVLELLSDLTFDCGLDTVELVSLLRQASVQIAVRRQLQSGERVSISRISAVTGISRAEISRLLKSGSDDKSRARESVLNKILGAWHNDARFATRRRPKALKLYGRGASFESLVKLHGRGLPIRAIFDELMNRGAIELLPSQTIVLKKPFAAHGRVTRKDLEALGERVNDIFRGSWGENASNAMEDSPRKRRNLKRIG
jgi:hypothetical protein